MKCITVERRRAKTGNYAIRKAEQLRGIFKSSSPFKYTDEGEGMSFENFKQHKKGKK
jgi:hypothetical protein